MFKDLKEYKNKRRARSRGRILKNCNKSIVKNSGQKLLSAVFIIFLTQQPVPAASVQTDPAIFPDDRLTFSRGVY